MTTAQFNHELAWASKSNQWSIDESINVSHQHIQLYRSKRPFLILLSLSLCLQNIVVPPFWSRLQRTTENKRQSRCQLVRFHAMLTLYSRESSTTEAEMTGFSCERAIRYISLFRTLILATTYIIDLNSLCWRFEWLYLVYLLKPSTSIYYTSDIRMHTTYRRISVTNCLNWL